MSENIAETIARKLGKDGLEYLEKNGELPAMKLTSEEMNFLKGGLTFEKGSALDQIIKWARSLF